MTAVSFSEIVRFAQDEAERIEAVQRGLVDAGLRKAPDRDQRRRKEICEAIVRLVELVTSDQVIADRLRQRAREKQLNKETAQSDQSAGEADG